MKPTKTAPVQPSPKLAGMLQTATRQQREEAIRIAARLLAIRAKKPKDRERLLEPEGKMRGLLLPKADVDAGRN